VKARTRSGLARQKGLVWRSLPRCGRWLLACLLAGLRACWGRRERDTRRNGQAVCIGGRACMAGRARTACIAGVAAMARRAHVWHALYRMRSLCCACARRRCISARPSFHILLHILLNSCTNTAGPHYTSASLSSAAVVRPILGRSWPDPAWAIYRRLILQYLPDRWAPLTPGFGERDEQ
jgi:hypothetical protein